MPIKDSQRHAKRVNITMTPEAITTLAALAAHLDAIDGEPGGASRAIRYAVSYTARHLQVPLPKPAKVTKRGMR